MSKLQKYSTFKIKAQHIVAFNIPIWYFDYASWCS